MYHYSLENHCRNRGVLLLFFTIFLPYKTLSVFVTITAEVFGEQKFLKSYLFILFFFLNLILLIF